jgi:hypothetical protein
MDTNALLQTWKKYIDTKLKKPTGRAELVAKLKAYNNNQQHIHPQITKQAEYIINKLIHAFATSMITIYDTKIVDVVLSLFPEIDPELKKYITDFVAQAPWLQAIQQGFIKTLDIIKDYILYSHGPENKGETRYVLLEANINEAIYNMLNCWGISCFTLMFIKALFSLDTVELNLPYLFFIAGSYSVVDFMIDENTEHPQVIRDILHFFETELYGNQVGEQKLKETTKRSIHYLIHTYKNDASPNPSKLQSIIYSMATEKECFKKQRNPHLTHDEIIELTINKGLSTGYLIMSGLATDYYTVCTKEMPDRLAIFNQYCVLLQLLDDLSDFTKDSNDGIITSAKLFNGDYNGFAWFALDCLLDFLEKVNTLHIFTPQMIKAFNLLFINYWCYCCNKNMAFLDDSIITVIKKNYIVDMDYVIHMRNEKHKKKYELYKLLLSGPEKHK